MPYNVYRRYRRRHPDGPIFLEPGEWRKVASGVSGPPFTDEDVPEGLNSEWAVSEVYPNGIESPRGHVASGKWGTPILWPAMIDSLVFAFETFGPLETGDLEDRSADEDGDPVGGWRNKAGEDDFRQFDDASRGTLRFRPNFLSHVRFDGTDDYLEENVSDGLVLTEAFTLVARVRPADTSSANPILARWKDDTDDRSIDLRGAAGGSLELYLSSDGVAETVISSEAGALQAGVTQEVVATYDGSAGTASLWVSGVEVASTSSAPASLYNPDVKFAMGRSMHGNAWDYLNGGVALARGFTESLADKKIPRVKRQTDVHAVHIRGEGRQLPPDEIPGLRLWLRAGEGIYQDTSAQAPADAAGDPVALWQDRSDGQAYDLSQSDDAARPVLQRRGDGSAYVEFDGTQYLAQGSSIVSGSQNRTLLIKGRFKGSGSQDRPVSQGHNEYAGTAILVTGESGVRVFSGYRLWQDTPFTSRGVLSIILDGTETTDLSAYLNGALATPTDDNPQSINTASDFFWLGAEPYPDGTVYKYSPGEIESILLYDRALPKTERQQVERYLGA